jgi:hypothetical protein
MTARSSIDGDVCVIGERSDITVTTATPDVTPRGKVLWIRIRALVLLELYVQRWDLFKDGRDIWLFGSVVQSLLVAYT